MFKSALLTLGSNSVPAKELLFSLRSSGAAQRWAEVLERANKYSHIREGQRWYNFPHCDNEKQICERINQSTRTINESFPHLIAGRMANEGAQEYVNRVHTFFADTNLQKNYVNPSTSEAWNELNNSLHAYESFLSSLETEKLAGIPECNIILTWEDPLIQSLEPADYLEFTVAKKFGTLYISYCQTGRHLYELFLADDQIAADEHILPLRSLSANTYIWFGSTTGPQSLARREAAIKSWFEKNSARLNRLGFHWGDPKLAIGWIPVADLVGDYQSLPNQLALLDIISRESQVISLRPL